MRFKEMPLIVQFNRTPMALGGAIEQPSQELIRNTLSLYNASPEDAIKYGGELTRAALGAVRLYNDHKYVVVDTKVHMLMPGFLPAIPGWHTDGVPRNASGSPKRNEPPDIRLQDDPALSAPRYHLLVTGTGCITEFLEGGVRINLPDEPTTSLYADVNREINELIDSKWIAQNRIVQPPSCQVIEWDWWQLHRGPTAKIHEWRFLMRVVETDTFPPQTDLRKIVRIQQQVYTPANYGW